MELRLDTGSWRRDAARIVEELFPRCATSEWDALLDLRGLLLSGRDWSEALRLFAQCRARLESDHYLPFYRLRRLLCASLELAGADRGELRRFLADRARTRSTRLAASSVVEVAA